MMPATVCVLLFFQRHNPHYHYHNHLRSSISLPENIYVSIVEIKTKAQPDEQCHSLGMQTRSSAKPTDTMVDVD